ncbi:MAG: copper amine oxidase N-terminal domain-containing protein [Defluviitaleaceae bacterium]|nr:copper amine oxidase N-terminal domain-containing protein [Defluviitaleaceae bacterium]
MKKERIKIITAFVAGVVATLLISGAALIANPVMREVVFGVNVIVDGEVVHFDQDMRPFIIDGRTFLPVRAMADIAGFNVDFDNATNTVVLTTGNGTNVIQPQPSPSPSPTASPFPSPSPTSSPTSSPSSTSSPTSSPSSSPSSQSSRPTNPAISLQNAIDIAYNDLASRNISATFHSDSGMDWERGQWVWELEFRIDGSRTIVEYYINIDIGTIVKFEIDN